MSASLLIVEDDRDLAQLLANYLKAEKFDVDMADSGAAMRAALAGRAYDLIVLDLGLPDEDGLALAQWLRREWPDLPIIMATGKSDPVDRVVGIEVGADDYLVKPVYPRELLARVRAVLRRAGGPAAGKAAVNGATEWVEEFDGLRLNRHARTLHDRDGQLVSLTSAEFTLLAALAEQPGQAITRDVLLEKVHHRRWTPLDRSIDQLVRNVRRKIERNADDPVLLQSVRGTGYLLVCRQVPA
jgi:two-component system OmpR family response regulator